MEKVTIDGVEYIFKKDINTVPLTDFKAYYNSINATGDTEYHELDNQMFQVSIITGLSVKELGDMDTDDCKELSIKAYQFFCKELNSEPILDIETSQGKFSITRKNNGSFKISTNDIKIIKENVIGDSTAEVFEVDFAKKLDVLAAILFRDETGDMSPEAIQKRAELFDKEMSVGYVYPYIWKIIDKFK